MMATMNSTPTLTPAELWELLRRHRLVWLAPAVAGFLLAALVSLVLPRPWKASQGILIRSEAAGYSQQRLGKFTDLSEMKTVQETVLELARSQSVVTAVYSKSAAWPTAQDIADFRQNLMITPPGGAEFGKTEVFYLAISDTDKDRAAELVRVMASFVDRRMKQIRAREAESMVAELSDGVSAAQSELEAKLKSLAKFEAEVGTNLSELRILVSPLGGQSEIGQQTLAVKTDLRQAQVDLRRSEQLLVKLQSCQHNPEEFLATPNSLLAAHPALQRLKDGVVDAQLAVARLAGSRSDKHPLVIAAKEAQTQATEELRNELPLAIEAIRMDLQLAADRAAELEAQLVTIGERSQSLAAQRAPYSRLVAEVENQTQVVDTALKQLNDARAHLAGATSASVLEAIDAVEISHKPSGPGRTSVAGAGGVAGLILGLGLVFLWYAPQPQQPKVQAAPFRTAEPIRNVRPRPIAEVELERELVAKA